MLRQVDPDPTARGTGPGPDMPRSASERRATQMTSFDPGAGPDPDPDGGPTPRAGEEGGLEEPRPPAPPSPMFGLAVGTLLALIVVILIVGLSGGGSDVDVTIVTDGSAGGGLAAGGEGGAPAAGGGDGMGAEAATDAARSPESAGDATGAGRSPAAGGRTGAEGSTRSLVARVRESIVLLYLEMGRTTRTGTGFVFDGRGHVATNDHVSTGTEEMGARLASGEERRARVLARDEAHDLAILALDPPGGVPAVVLGDSDKTAIGDDILVFGFPLGMTSEITVTTGIVSSMRREIGLLQISAAVNRGNSGGPVVSRATGEVVAVVTAKHRVGEGVGFAVPVNELRRLAREAVR